MITATRFHDFCAGHRVAGHENKCSQLHGHNYRIHFTCTANELDALGRVIDFSAIKEKLCDWLEHNWDHKMLFWSADSFARTMFHLTRSQDFNDIITDSVVTVPFNPTAENMAKYLVEKVGPDQLAGTGVELVKVVVEETRKCSATYELGA